MVSFARWCPLPDGVDLWWVDLDQAPPLDRLKTVLSIEERERTDRFRTPQLQHRFAACRAQLRGILSRYVGKPPAQLEFCYGPQGKPALVLSDVEFLEFLEFNVSHCQGEALYGVGWRPLGVDLERLRSMAQPLDLARRFFAPSEVATLAALPPDQQSCGFLRYWVGKEALLKAMGTGIANGLDRVVLTLQPTLQIQALPPDRGLWSLQEIAIPAAIDSRPPSPPTSPTWVAALATAEPALHIQWRSPSWEFLAENQQPRYNS
ncbi:MAG: 4'-phosphopantetheinyl transferase family protein [Prochlorothrix sp.]